MADQEDVIGEHCEMLRCNSTPQEVAESGELADVQWVLCSGECTRLEGYQVLLTLEKVAIFKWRLCMSDCEPHLQTPTQA